MDQNINQLTQDLRKMTESNEKLIGMFGNMLKRQDLSDRSKARAKSNDSGGFWDGVKADYNKSRKGLTEFDGAVGRAAGGVSGGLKLLSKDLAGAQSAFQTLAKTVLGATIGGAIIGGVTSFSMGMTNTYKDLAEYGQTFTDGIFGMAKAAMAGQVSMDEYARMTKRNSVVMAQMGSKQGGLAGLAAQVRENAEQFGGFSYTVAGLNDLVGDYMETQRIQGRLDKMSKEEASHNLLNLAETTSTLSNAFGKSRKEITETAQSVMRSTAATIALGTMTTAQAKRMGPAFETAVSALSAQAGEAGKMLPQFLADTIAADGNEALTGTGKLIAKMLPGATGLTESLANKIDGLNPDEVIDATNEYNKKMLATYESQKDNLKYLRLAGGETGAQADQIIRMMSGIKVLSGEELKSAKERAKVTDKYTKLMSNLENQWGRFSSKVLDIIFPMIEKPLQAIGEAFDQFAKNGASQTLTDNLTKIGTIFSDFVRSFTKTENMERLTGQIVQWLTGFSKFVGDLFGTTPQVGDQSRATASDAGQKTFDTIAKVGTVLNTLGDAIIWTKNNFDKLVTTLEYGTIAIAGVWAAMKGIGIAKAALGVYKMTVEAKNVTINGDGKGLFDRFRGGKDGEGHGPRGRGGRGGRLGRFLKFGAGAAAAGAAGVAGVEGVLDTVKDGVEGAIEKASPEVKAEATPATPKVEGVEAKAGAEPAIPKGETAGGVKGMLKGGIGGLAMKGLGLVSMALDGAQAAVEAKEAWNEYQKNGNGSQFAQALISNLVPKATGWIGATLLGSAGAAAGSVAPGIGTAAVGLAAGSAGYMGGEIVGDKIAGGINTLVDYFTGPKAPAAAGATPPTPPAPARLSENQMQDIQTAQAQVTDRLQSLERQGATEDPNAKKTLELLQQLLESMKSGTEVNAAFLQKIADVVNGGNRRITSAINNTPR